MSYSDTMYHQYKSLTSCVVSWLVATGAGAGCPTSLIQPSPENKTTANAYQLQLAKFVPLTEWIKDCKESVHVPRSILKDLDRVIDLRLRYSRALRGSRQPTADDDSHGYFVDVLRKLQKVLRRFPTAQSKKKATLESSMSAIFSVLEMEDMSDKEESDAVERQEFLARVDDKVEYTYATENIPPIEEATVHFQLLLDDFEKLGQHVHEQWDRYIAGTVDLTAAASATNMALLFAKGLKDTARESIVTIMFADTEGRQVTLRKLSKQMRMTEQATAPFLDGNIYMPLHNFLLGISQAAEVASDDDYRLEKNTLQTTWMAMTGWFFDICFRQKASGNLVHAEERDHSYSAPWEEQSVGDKRRTLSAFATETATELHFIGSLRDRAPIQDELSRNIFHCDDEKNLYISATDIFRALKAANQNAGISSAIPFFTLRRHPILCGLLLLAERALAQDTAFTLERNLGGLTDAIHLGHAFTTQNLIPSLGVLKPTAARQPNTAFYYIGGKRPTEKSAYLAAYSLAIGKSIANTGPAHTRHQTGAAAPLATRKQNLELTVPGAVVARRAGTPARSAWSGGAERGRSGGDVAWVGACVDAEGVWGGCRGEGEGKGKEKDVDKGKGKAVMGAGSAPKPAPLKHASLLIHAEVPVLEHGYLDALRVAWEVLRAVQAVLGGPVGSGQAGGSRGRGGRGRCGRRRAGRGGGRGGGSVAGGQENDIDPAEVVVGRVFADGTSESVFEAAGKAFGEAVTVKTPAE